NLYDEWEWEIVETSGYLAKTIAVLWRDPYSIYYENKRGDIGVMTTLTTPCPFCHQRHEHGIGDGHREPHCATRRVAPSASLSDGITVFHKDGYIIRTRATKR